MFIIKRHCGGTNCWVFQHIEGKPDSWTTVCSDLESLNLFMEELDLSPAAAGAAAIV
eukprot:Pgem_evm1s13202